MFAVITGSRYQSVAAEAVLVPATVPASAPPPIASALRLLTLLLMIGLPSVEWWDDTRSIMT
ncbi:hypothetical protein GCM10028864_52560 [Microlunatus parietis]